VSVVERPVAQRDINCRTGQGANSVGSTVCDSVKEAVDVKPWPRRTPAPEVNPHYYTGNDGDQNADHTGFLIPKPPTTAPTKAEKEPAAGAPAKEAEVKKAVEKTEAAEEEKKAAKPKEAPKTAPPAEEAKFLYVARALPNGDFIYQRPDIACRDGQGANSVGSSVCDVIKEAVDVKPWPRRNYEPAGPAHSPQYYHGNEGDINANADGILAFHARRVDPYT
jgi:hypothetical protein